MTRWARIPAILASLGRPRRTDFFGLAARERRVPGAELAVAEAALAGGGPIADRAVRQLRETPEVYRLRREDGSYELRIVTTGRLAIRGVPRDGWTSPSIPVETDRGRRLELRIAVVHAGIAGMTGRTGDGAAWPATWRLAAASLERIRAAAPLLDVPTPAEICAERARAARVIGEWLGDPELVRGRRGILQANAPATEEALGALEARDAFTLPEAYRSLLQVADGIEVGPAVLLGSADAYRFDAPGPARLVVTPPDETGAWVIDESGIIEWIRLDDGRARGRYRTAHLRAWVAKRVRRRPR